MSDIIKQENSEEIRVENEWKVGEAFQTESWGSSNDFWGINNTNVSISGVNVKEKKNIVVTLTSESERKRLEQFLKAYNFIYTSI